MKAHFSKLYLLAAASVMMSCTQMGMNIDKATSTGIAAKDQPCWVLGDPSCADQTEDYLYFRGQSAVPEASNTRPSESAFESARLSAKTQYVTMISETVSKKTSQALTNAGSQAEGTEVVAALKTLSENFAAQTVSGLRDADVYYVSEGKNSKNIPLWTTYVLMKVPREHIKQNFNNLVGGLEKRANEGNAKAKSTLKGVQEVQKQMAEDKFFDGF